MIIIMIKNGDEKYEFFKFTVLVFLFKAFLCLNSLIT